MKKLLNDVNLLIIGIISLFVVMLRSIRNPGFSYSDFDLLDWVLITPFFVIIGYFMFKVVKEWTSHLF